MHLEFRILADLSNKILDQATEDDWHYEIKE